MPYQDVYDQVRAADIARDQAIKDNAFQNSQYAYTLQQQGARQQAGNAFASGDIPGAAQTLYKAGDIAGGQQAQQYDDATRQKHAQAALRISQGIRAATAAGHTPQEAFAMATQIAPQLGIDPKDLANMKPAFDQNPQAFLDMVDQQAKKELQFFQTKGGIYAGDKATGRVTQSMALPAEPNWKEVKNADGSSTFVDMNDPRNQGGASGTPAAPAQASVAPAAGQPRGVRNNNPLNLTSLSNGQQWAGQTGSDGRYATFSSPDQGFAAADKNLQAYAKHGVTTLAGVINRWAPPTENDTASYIGRVAKDVGIAPNQPLDLSDPQIRQKLLTSMAKVETGQAAPNLGGSPASQAGAYAGRRVQGSAPGGDKKAKWDIYVDPKTNTPYRYNSATAEATTIDGKPYTPSGLAKVSGGGTPRSAAALAVQRFVQEHPEATAEDISQFNANLNKERSATTAFGTGKQGQTINSLNVSIDHLNTLSNLAGALGNGDVKLLNRWSQQWKAQTGNPAPTNFIAAKQIVGDEIVKGIVGAGGGVADREKAQAAISEASSPAQLAGVIGTYKHLLAGQLNGLRLQYKNTTGRADFEDKLLPATRGELEGVGPTARTAPPRNRPPLTAIFR